MIRKVVPYEVVADDIVRKLMTPLQAFLPDVVQPVFEAFNGGRAPDLAGQALLEALQDQLQKIRAIEQEKQKELYQTIRELEQKFRAGQQEIQSKQKEIDDLNEAISEKKKVFLDLQNIIARQNRLLADQHDQIANLCGLQEDDTHA